MSRKKRYITTGIPQLILLSGNQGDPCFFVDKDYAYFLQLLTDAASRFHCDIHAYVLMPNHLHLLSTAHSSKAMSNMLQSVSSDYAAHIRETYGRTDNIWQSGFRSSPLESEPYLLKAMAFIDQNPLRASLVDQLADYPWSSYHHNALNQQASLITPHSLYRALSEIDDERAQRYKKLLDQNLDEDTLTLMNTSVVLQNVIGSSEFAEEITDKSPSLSEVAECTDCVMYY